MTPEYEKRLEQLVEYLKRESQRARSPKHEEELSRLYETALDAQAHIKWFATVKGLFVSMRTSQQSVLMFGVPSSEEQPDTAIYSEQLDGERARVVVPVTRRFAEYLRSQGVPMHPAPVDATEALTRAAHSLAGAALELCATVEQLRKEI